jgi:hypothetical protein
MGARFIVGVTSGNEWHARAQKIKVFKGHFGKIVILASIQQKSGMVGHMCIIFCISVLYPKI